ncbi:MAG: N-acetyltransferase [Propionibacteriaceae bacterium]|jgi:predicted GNAT family acetyltransferase|nr:N-acetyltransferase [Propionibacteriaceae bacterium]
MDFRETGSRFEAIEDGRVVGWLIYRDEGDGVLALNHTIVPDSGHGIGSALVKHVLEEVEARGGSVVPNCPFVRSYIADHPEFADLVVLSDDDQNTSLFGI